MQYRTKVTLILLAAVGVTGGLLLWLSHRNAYDLVFKLIQEKVLAVAVSTAPQVDGDAHEKITLAQRAASQAGRDDENLDYVTVRKPMRDSRDANTNPESEDDEIQKWILPVKFIYTIRPRTDGDRSTEEPYEYVVDAEEDGDDKSDDDKSEVGDIVEFREGEEIIPEMGVAQVDSIYAEDDYGRWLTAFAPIKNSKGEDVALLGVDVGANLVIKQMNKLLIGGLIALLFAFIAASLASIFLSGMVTAPLRALGKQVALIRKGDFTTRIPIDAKDEFGELGDAIHEMADGLKEREAFKDALVRFVSSGKTDSVIEESGMDGSADASRRVTVLTASLKGLESVTEFLGADKVFGFLSDWYSSMIDIILRHRGSLEKSAAETVTSTFGAPLNDPDQERHALEAALTIQQELTGLRRRWKIPGEANLLIEASIHTGHVNVSDQDDIHIIEADSFQRIIGAVSLIQNATRSASDGIVVSEATADGLKGSIPLNYLKSIEVPGTGELLSLHTVQMPSPEA